MPYRTIALALALSAAALLAGAPGLAQQATPAASSSPPAAPEPTPSPSPPPSPEPTPVPSPSPQHAASHSLSGTLESIKGTIATVRLADGGLQTYTVSAKAAALLKKSIGKKLAFRVLHGALDVLPH